MKSFTATPKLVKSVGEKWKGTYEINVLSAEEYIKMGDDLFRKGSEIPRSRWNFQLFLRCVTHNGKPVEKDIPSKILEMLMPDVIELNAYTLEEERSVFLQRSTESQHEKDISKT